MGKRSLGAVNNLLKVVQQGSGRQDLSLGNLAFTKPKLGGIPLFHGEEERGGVFSLLWSPAFHPPHFLLLPVEMGFLWCGEKKRFGDRAWEDEVQW